MSEVESEHAGRDYLVIGGAGFLALLARKEPHVAVYDLNNPPEGDALEGATYFLGDILDESNLLDVLNKHSITTVFHVVSPIHGLGRELYYRVNIEGTKSILSACRKASTVTSLVFTSSTGCVWAGQTVSGATEEELTYLTDDKFDVYGYTKGRAEETVLKANGEDGVRTVAIRPCGMLGPRDNQGMWQIAAALESGQYVYKFGKEDVWSDMTYPTKSGPTRPTATRISGQAFFVNNGEPIRYRHYPVTTWNLMGAEEKTVVIPLWVGWIMAKISELSFWFTGKRGPLTMYSYTVMTTDQYYSSEKAKKVLGWEPRWWNDRGAEQHAQKQKRKGKRD
ncbi:NAD(P)-binding protein [Coprinellus micaceus]|uniref:NAD(P)-binding protein n=1 Tax=Coprinellus micaceus TaxID=71717 RepID=A0A4Y7TIR1_COPMI|nr:NAD(P)-binding protein [Coprinellus micaceus]